MKVMRIVGAGSFARRQRWLFVALIALLLGLWFISRSQRDERAVLETLEAVLHEASVRESDLPGRRDQRLQDALERYFTDPVVVRYSDLPKTGSGRRALLLWGRLLGQLEEARLVIEHQMIEVAEVPAAGKERSGVATVDVVLEARRDGKQWSDRRSVELGLLQVSGRWQIQSIEVAARSAAQPEARP